MPSFPSSTRARPRTFRPGVYGAALALTLFAFGCDDDTSETPAPTPDATADASPDGAVLPDAGPEPEPDPGALVQVQASSTVGVLLDELPAAMRDRVAEALLARPEAFWIDRATQQMRLANYRLVYRGAFYDEEDGKGSLPLPPEPLWRIALSGPPSRRTVDGHDLVAVDFTFESTLLSPLDSPAESEPALAEVGGEWSEPFVFPIDPTLIVQRTGYACMDEDGFPRFSVDAESAHIFYDHECEAEAPGEESCHLSGVLPEESCLEALDARVGKVELTVDYTRLPWDAAVADAARHGDVTTREGPDLRVSTEHLAINRVVYEYVSARSCAFVEGCVAQPGWRRLLRFDSATLNVGGAPVEIGAVDYFLEGDPADVDNHRHGVYAFSECHEHYHFQHYGEFGFGDMPGRKDGFCLESTDRGHNNELTPLASHFGCDYQGVDIGWYDLYHGGLPCNWIDVTDVDTAGGPVEAPLRFDSNPDQFVCEGSFVTDADGAVMWESTEFVAEDGAPVDRPLCDFVDDHDVNNHGAVDVTLPTAGGGMVTGPCARGELGPLRDCGFAPAGEPMDCTAGEAVTLSCTIAAGAAPQAVRACPVSAALGLAIPCVHRDAAAIAVVDGADVAVQVTCPAALGDGEPGGRMALFTAPAFGPDGAAPVDCQLAP